MTDEPLICEHCRQPIRFAPGMPEHPWRHEATGFRRCDHGPYLIWAEPALEVVSE